MEGPERLAVLSLGQTPGQLQDMTKVHPLPSWFYKGNGELLLAKLETIRTMGNSVKLV